jgi:hypothetical protein
LVRRNADRWPPVGDRNNPVGPDADWPFFPPDRIEDVRLEGPKSTAKLLVREGPYTPNGVALIAERLRARVPEA